MLLLILLVLTTDPPPVNEDALARRLFAMTAPSSGERAVIVYDPTYYPGITGRLREALHEAGVDTFVLVEDSPDMIARYLDDPVRRARREAEVVEAHRPLFTRADIFYWMPTRGYADDLRWEKLVGESRVRSVHFHWMLRFPGRRSAGEIETTSRTIERMALDVDLPAHTATQRRLAERLRGQTIRMTTPAGTDLTVRVPPAQWFHFGDGDASKARAATARSIRDRQMELPVGMFLFVPNTRTFTGTLIAPAINQAGANVRQARFEFKAGRASLVSAELGDAWIRERMRSTGPDGDRIGTIHMHTHPMSDHGGLSLDIGANWENGGTNRATGMRRMTIRLGDATITTAEGMTIMRDGKLVQ